MAVYVYVATSLDGFIAGPQGELDWLMDIPNPENSDYGFAEFMEDIDALVMGRNTFEKVLTFGDWPYEKPVYVLSTTLQDVPGALQGKAEVIQGDPKSIVAQLAARGHENLYIDGGRVVQTFLNADLVDELILTRVPILLGDGIPLFGPLDQKLAFSHQGNKSLSAHLSQDRYSRRRG